MTQERYKELLLNMAKQYEHDKNLLKKEFALSNNPYKVDDIVTDHIGSLQIKKIEVYLSDLPQCVYFGVELKKDLTPVKKQTGRGAYQSNLIPDRCFLTESGTISKESFANIKTRLTAPRLR